MILIGKVKKKMALARSKEMNKFYQEKIDLLKSETTNYDGLVYFIYSYDNDGNFKILYVGITKKYGSNIKCKCRHSNKVSYYSPEIIEKIELKDEIKHRTKLTCPKCKIEFEKTLKVNRNLTNPLFFGRLGDESARHLGQLNDALLYILGILKDEDISISRMTSLTTKIKWVKDFFGKNPSLPPKLIKPLYFSAVLWKERPISELGNKTIAIETLERILQDIGKLLNPNILNKEFIKLSKSKRLVKTYQKIINLIEKIYGNLDSISDDSKCNTEIKTAKKINGISRKAKQLSKLNKKWFYLEDKNKKILDNIISTRG